MVLDVNGYLIKIEMINNKERGEKKYLISKITTDLVFVNFKLFTRLVKEISISTHRPA